MGEKGNITSDELAAAASASAESGGVGAVIAGAGTTGPAGFGDTGATVRGEVVDQAADAGIATAQESWRSRHPEGETNPESTEQPK